MEKITISLPVKQLEKVDNFVETGEYPSRSDVVRAAIRDFKPVQDPGVPA
jgi:Arc/MetJ-type ribon-helix-helix transcriptional regulator